MQTNREALLTRHRPIAIFPIVIGLFSALGAYGQEAEKGIARQYAGDRGILADPDVLFAENFEDSLSGILAGWTDVKNPDGIALVNDAPPGSAGSTAVKLTCEGGRNTGAHFYKLMTSLATEPVLFLRYYVKYVDSTSRYHHAGGRLGGYNPPIPYPLGGAGIRPTGKDKFTVALEPYQRSRPARHQFYNYWVGMKAGGDGKFYGNVLLMEKPAVSAVEYDTWFAVEIMVKLNTIGKCDGEVAAWVNGNKVAHYRPGSPVGKHGPTFTPGAGQDTFPGIEFRTDSNLAVNFIKLELYSSRTPEGMITQIMYDDVVVARRYIGPLPVEK